MPLSLSKLQNLLMTKGFFPSKYFIMNGTCFYIELMSAKSADTFLLYIPSKYKFEVGRGDNVFKIRYIDMDSGGNTVNEYAGEPDNVDIEAVYGDANIELSPDKDGHIEEHLENNYKHPISLKDISKDDTKDLKAIYRQLQRLRYCVQNIKYKIAIMYQNYVCSIRRDDSIDCFALKHYPRQDCKRMMVIIDLEMFYSKNEQIDHDITTVRTGIYRVLEKNQGYHSKIMAKMVANKSDIVAISQRAQVKTRIYTRLISQSEGMLVTLNNAEEKFIEELHSLNGSAPQALQEDIDRSHRRTRIEKELEKIGYLKQDVIRNITAVREKRESSVLSIDKIMFDNTVMFDCMVKNFGLLKGFC